IYSLARLCHVIFFFSSRRRHTRLVSDWSSDVCSSDLLARAAGSSKAEWPEEGERAELAASPYASLVGQSAAMNDVYRAIRRVRRSEERRVGKEGRARGARDD